MTTGRIVEYSYSGTWADGTHHTDTVYVEHPAVVYAEGCDTCGWTSSFAAPHNGALRARYCTGIPRKLNVRLPIIRERGRIWDVQDYPSKNLATPMDRKWAAKWLRVRRLAGRPMVGEMVPGPEASNVYVDRHGRGEMRIHGGWFNRRTHDSLWVPNKPVDVYDRDKIVLHEENDDGSLHGYGYSSGVTVYGTHFVEMRLDVSNMDDFHRCGTEGSSGTDHGDHDEEDCPCVGGYCDCISKLEECTGCGKDLGDGDTVWLAMDGGEYYCPDEIINDERPDSLFKRVGGVRGAHLPEFAWPGGYCIVYSTKGGGTICADCADQVEVSDPAVGADVDEEMDCVNCEHAPSFHRSEKAHRTDGNSDDVGPCDYDEQTQRRESDNNEQYTHCDCVGYFPPLCDDCSRPIDPALREWWAGIREMRGVEA